MNTSNTFENEFLKLLFQNVTIAGIGDAAGLLGSAAAGNLYIRLCTDAIAASDSQLGAECAYVGYVAGGVAVPRSSAGWSVLADTIKNAAEVVFGTCNDGAENIRYVEIWRNNSGNAEADRIAWAQLTADIAVAAGVTPKFAAESIVVTFD